MKNQLSETTWKNYAHTSHDLPLKSDWSQYWTSKMGYVVHDLRSDWFRPRLSSKSNSLSTKAQQNQSISTFSQPSQLVIVLLI